MDRMASLFLCNYLQQPFVSPCNSFCIFSSLSFIMTATCRALWIKPTWVNGAPSALGRDSAHLASGKWVMEQIHQQFLCLLWRQTIALIMTVALGWHSFCCGSIDGCSVVVMIMAVTHLCLMVVALYIQLRCVSSDRSYCKYWRLEAPLQCWCHEMFTGDQTQHR